MRRSRDVSQGRSRGGAASGNRPPLRLHGEAAKNPGTHTTRSLERVTSRPGQGAPPDAERAAPRRDERAGIGRALEVFSHKVAHWVGSSPAFTVALALVVAWALTGPVFGFSDTWQLVINTATTVVTFLMVFLIQRAQNKDTRAIALKLDELIAAAEGASNRLIEVEQLSEEELRRLHDKYARLVDRARSDPSLTESHSIEETRDPGE